ncbi:MAG: Cof-type HAD-IIB family hydrolase [Ruminococcus sp.]|nr:Cof-type HAD-IIB family hydrolase [Ruminococcus sp.]MDE7225250.1 Cof-type HAD-IIB family hydrolase [Ruminococcus sp.]
MDITKTIIFSDMDGTLLNSEKQINEIDRKAIEKFVSLGGKFTIATGRTIQTFARYKDMLNLRMPVIMYNGAMIYDYISGNVLYSRCLPETSRKITGKIMNFMPECGGEVLRTDGTYVFSNNKQEQLHTNLCGIEPEYMEINEIPDGDWLKVLFALAPERISLLENKIRRMGYYEHADFVRSSDIFLEMLPKGTSKGSALDEYRRLDGMEDFTFVAIGDFDNDIEMIVSADIGVCPANAEKTVRSISDIVLESTNDNGAVAELINYIINKAED